MRAAVGVHPHDADGFTAGRRGLDPRPRGPPGGGRDRRVRPGPPPRQRRAPEAQRRAFSAQIGLAREAGLPLVVHTRDAADETLDVLDRRGGRPPGRAPLLLHARAPGRGRRARLPAQLRRAGRPTRSRPTSRRAAARRRPDDLAPRRDRQPLPRPGAPARPAQPAGQRGPHAALRRRPARRHARRPSTGSPPATPPASSPGEPGVPGRRPGAASCGCSRPTACARTPTWASTSCSTRTSSTWRSARPASAPSDVALRGRRRPRGADRRARARGPRPCTRSRSTGAWSPRSPRSLRAHATSGSTGATPCACPSRSSTRRRRSSSPTCPTRSPPPLVLESLWRLPARRPLVRDGAARGRRPLARASRAAGSTGRPRCCCGWRPSPPSGAPWAARSSPRARASTPRWSRCGAPAPGPAPAVRALVRAAFALAAQDARQRARRPPGADKAATSPRPSGRLGPAARRRAPRQLPPAAFAGPGARSWPGRPDPRGAGQAQPAAAGRGPAAPTATTRCARLMVALDGLADARRRSPAARERRVTLPGHRGRRPTSPGGRSTRSSARPAGRCRCEVRDRQAHPRAGRPGRRLERRRRRPGRPPTASTGSASGPARWSGWRRGWARTCPSSCAAAPSGPRAAASACGPARRAPVRRAARQARAGPLHRRGLRAPSTGCRAPAARRAGTSRPRRLPALGGLGCATTSGRRRSRWRPALRRASARALAAAGAPAVLLCGSGSCLAGLFPDRAAAEAAAGASTRPASGPSRRPSPRADESGRDPRSGTSDRIRSLDLPVRHTSGNRGA